MNKLVSNIISIEDFIHNNKNNMSESDLNWELKGYIHSMIDLAEKSAEHELDSAKDNNIISNKEWFEAHSLISDIWFKMRSIISDMWFNNDLLKSNAEEIFMEKAEPLFINILKNIESENLKSFLL